jgi:hypothetical protein
MQHFMARSDYHWGRAIDHALSGNREHAEAHVQDYEKFSKIARASALTGLALTIVVVILYFTFKPF